VFYDVVASEIRFIQRKGRTARHREGKVIILYCKGTHDEIYMHIALTKLKKMNVNLKGEKQLQNVYSNSSHQIPETPIIQELQNNDIENSITIPQISKRSSNPSLRPTKKINKKGTQSSLISFSQERQLIDKISNPQPDIKLNVSFPVKFGLRKKFQKDGISFKIVKSILDLTLFDKVLIQVINPRLFDGASLLKKYALLSKKYKLIITVFDFVDIEEEFDNEEKLLKQKFIDWGEDNKIQAITIDLSEELYFILKNIYLHVKNQGVL